MAAVRMAVMEIGAQDVIMKVYEIEIGRAHV